MASSKKPLRSLVLWALAGILVAVVALATWLIVPIVSASPQGASGQPLQVEGFPLSVSATGDDGRTRTLSATREAEPGEPLSNLVAGDRIVVTGAGYNAASGIYVAICKIPREPQEKPGPCLGGVPSTEPDEDPREGVIEWGPSNWINDDWAWRLFGARSFDDRESGTFTAYIEVPGAADESVDCRKDPCGLYTRNDHTALDDRVQDLYLPVSFGG